MADYRTMFDRDYIGAWDLAGKDVTVTIAAVRAGELTGSQGKRAKKPLISFEGASKAFACNKTNAKIIASLYGNDVQAWVGQRITLYPTRTQFGAETVDCIRVRPSKPPGAGKGSSPPAALEPREPGEDG